MDFRTCVFLGCAFVGGMSAGPNGETDCLSCSAKVTSGDWANCFRWTRNLPHVTCKLTDHCVTVISYISPVGYYIDRVAKSIRRECADRNRYRYMEYCVFVDSWTKECYLSCRGDMCNSKPGESLPRYLSIYDPKTGITTH